MNKDDWPREKKWRHLYTRSIKMKRAQQLGFEYPRLNERERLETEIVSVLFVCTMNKWRSLTAEELYRKHPLLNCRSAGTSNKARRKIGLSDIRWADLIIVMEDKHHDRIEADYRDEIRDKEIHVLEVEDQFKYMDDELIEELQFVLDPIFLVES